MLKKLKLKKKKKDLSRRFQKRWYRPFKFYPFKTYTSAFESAGIGSTYSNVGIGYIHIFVKTVLTQVKMPEQGLESAGTYHSAFEKHWYRSSDPIPTFKPRRFEAPGKKMAG